MTVHLNECEREFKEVKSEGSIIIACTELVRRKKRQGKACGCADGCVRETSVPGVRSERLQKLYIRASG